jgi:putative ABC transport system permease protein
MRSQDIFSLAFKALKDRKLRSGLTILGIVIGTSLIVALIASTTGLTSGIATQISRMGVTTLSVTPTGRVRMVDEDVLALRSIDGVSEVIPYYSTRLSINYGSTTLSVQVFGFDQNLLSFLYRGLELARGSFTDMYDPVGAVIGSKIARPPEAALPSVDLNEMVLLQRGSTTGRSSSSSNVAYLVTGVLKPFGSSGFANIDETIFVSSVGATLMLKLTTYSGVYVIAESPDVVAAVQGSLQEYFGTNARIMGAQAMLETVQSITGQLTLFLGGIAAISLFVAGIGTMNTMFVSIMERTREIGVLKAIGYKSRDVLTMFLAEASLTGIIGGVLGTIVGVAFSFLLSGGLQGLGVRGSAGGQAQMGAGAMGGGMAMGFTPAITPELVVFSLLFPIGIAVIAGLYPAWRASRLNIVLALKYE